MGHEDSNMALDVYSSGLAIEPLVESINKLTFGEEVDSFIEEALTEESNGEVKDKKKIWNYWQNCRHPNPY